MSVLNDFTLAIVLIPIWMFGFAVATFLLQIGRVDVFIKDVLLSMDNPARQHNIRRLGMLVPIAACLGNVLLWSSFLHTFLVPLDFGFPDWAVFSWWLVFFFAATFICTCALMISIYIWVPEDHRFYRFFPILPLPWKPLVTFFTVSLVPVILVTLLSYAHSSRIESGYRAGYQLAYQAAVEHVQNNCQRYIDGWLFVDSKIVDLPIPGDLKNFPGADDWHFFLEHYRGILYFSDSFYFEDGMYPDFYDIPC